MAGTNESALGRRDFVAAMGSFAAAWVFADGSARRAAVDHARDQMAQSGQQKLLFFSPEQAAEIDAIASRIIPTDDTPGAHEAGVVYFLDHALTSFAENQRSVFVEGLRKLPDDVAAKVPGAARFSTLTPARQDDVLRGIEQTPFFGAMRFATLAGMFSLPSYGGNRDWIGWKLVGQDLAQDFAPPFGWYDDPRHRPRAAGGSPG